VWERVDPRIDRPEDLSQEIGSPASPVSAITPSGVNALVARWTMLADHGPSRIALVPVTADVQADLPKVALRLSQVQANGHQSQGNGASRQGTETLEEIAGSGYVARPIENVIPAMIVCEVPSADLTALESIMDCDLIVLVAKRGTSRAALRDSLDSLTEFGMSPKWAIFLGSSSLRLPGRAATR
jgi:hypothetical protein